MYKNIHMKMIAAILTIIMKRKIQEACEVSYKVSYNQKGTSTMLQYFICNKNAVKIRKMSFF